MLIINLSYLSFRATCALPFSPFLSFLPMRKRFGGVRRKSPSHSLILEFLRKYAFILRWRKPWMHCDVHCYLHLVRRFQTLSTPTRREREITSMTKHHQKVGSTSLFLTYNKGIFTSVLGPHACARIL